MNSERKFHYLEVNRGRYLCLRHGGFCDGSDGYQNCCPACSKSAKGFYSQVIPNKIDRILHLVNGLQGRSKRNVAMVSTLVAGVAALSVLGNADKLPEVIKIADRCSNANTWQGIVQVSVAALIASIGFFAASMSHIPQVKQGYLGEKTIREWEKLLVKELEKLELLSWLGGSAFIVAAFLLFISVLLPVFC